MTVFSDDIIPDLPLHLSEEVGEIFMIQFLFAEHWQKVNAIIQ